MITPSAPPDSLDFCVACDVYGPIWSHEVSEDVWRSFCAMCVYVLGLEEGK